MAIYRLDNQYTNYAGHWAANTAYTLGKRVMAESGNSGDARKYMFECTTAGTSQNPGPPTWDTTPGNTTSDGTVTWTCREATSWDNAHGRLDWLLLRTVADDFVYADDGHDYDYNVNAVITLTSPGTDATRVRILCVDKADDSISTGAKIQNAYDGFSAGLTFEGKAYSFGVYYGCGGNIIFREPTSGVYWTFEGTGNTLLLELTSTGSVARSITIGGTTSPSKVHIVEVFGGNIKFNSSADYQQFYCYWNSYFLWNGGKLESVNTANPIFDAHNAASYNFKLINVDLSAMSGSAILDAAQDSLITATCERCKLPSSYSPIKGSFSIYHGTLKLPGCSNATNTYEFREDSCFGTVENETTIVRAGGASDGTTPFSMKMATSTGAKEQIQPLISRAIHCWNHTVGTEVTFTVYIYNSSADLNDDDVWLDIQLPANDGGLGSTYFDRAGCGSGFNTRNPIATPATQADDTSIWNGSSDYSQKLQITITPGLVGQVTARIMLAKPSTTIYVDPVIYLS